MAESDTAKLDELKRLLRRLDKAVPQSLPDDVHVPHARTGPARPGSNATALRTIVLASTVSLIVSLGVAVLLVRDTPIRRFIVALEPSRADVRRDPVKTERPAAEDRARPVFSGETATLRADVAPQLQTKPPAPQKPAAHTNAGTAAVENPGAAETSATQGQTALSALMPNGGVTDAAAGASAAPAPPAQSAAPPPATVAAVSPPEVKPEALPQPSAALVELDAEQFLRRGLLMLSRGNVGAAQLLLERAADLGNGEAAFTLAGTYDGTPGGPRPGSEVRPNADLALRWYARAQELGVEAARKRLSELKDGTAAQN